MCFRDDPTKRSTTCYPLSIVEREPGSTAEAKPDLDERLARRLKLDRTRVAAMVAAIVFPRPGLGRAAARLLCYLHLLRLYGAQIWPQHPAFRSAGALQITSAPPISGTDMVTASSIPQRGCFANYICSAYMGQQIW